MKAIAFNPQLSNSLATGGGTTDRTIKFWNLSTGTLCHSEQTDSQVWNIASLFSTSEDGGKDGGGGQQVGVFLLLDVIDPIFSKVRPTLFEIVEWSTPILRFN